MELGKNVPLYPGVNEWFKLINDYAADRGIRTEHYIISSGLKEIIAGSEIAPHIHRIYASTFYYSPDNTALWPAQAVLTFTDKKEQSLASIIVARLFRSQSRKASVVL